MQGCPLFHTPQELSSRALSPAVCCGHGCFARSRPAPRLHRRHCEQPGRRCSGLRHRGAELSESLSLRPPGLGRDSRIPGGLSPPLTAAALGAGYQSPEAFTRTFARAYGLTPGRFRRNGRSYHLEAPNGIHFHPPGGIAVPADGNRRTHMDMVDRLVGHDIWFTTQLLDRAAQLPAEELDRPLPEAWTWGGDEPPTLRAVLNEMVANKENWSAALTGRDAPPAAGDGIEDLQRRYERAGAEFAGLVRGIRDRGQWDAGFVDALCDPPESFTYGGMLAHVATFSAIRRMMAIVAFRELGVTDIGLGDPIEWERSLA